MNKTEIVSIKVKNIEFENINPIECSSLKKLLQFYGMILFSFTGIKISTYHKLRGLINAKTKV